MKFYLFILLLFASIISAQGEAAVPFLLISPNAHNSGMGEAGAAYPETPSSAMHYNVAGLAYQAKHGDIYGTKDVTPLDFSYASWLPQLKLNDLWYSYGATRFEIEDIGVFGVSLRYINLGEVVVTSADASSPEGFNVDGRYAALETALNLAYSTELSENSYIGAGIKFIYSKLAEDGTNVGAENTASPGFSIAVDLGYYQLMGDWAEFFRDVRLGISWNNIGPSISYVDNDQSDPLPWTLRAGLGGTIVHDEFSVLRLEYDVSIMTLEQTLSKYAIGDIANRFIHNIGAEYIYDNIFSARFGVFLENKDFGDRKFFTAGLGFNADIIVLDASYIISASDNRHPLDGTVRFSFRFNL
ncbi:MAG: PorV/PorQ family protein [Calditrichaeota bacterium]|nr:PorV/PorQ family protein [Calditrichota bacterium]